jgi:hypothetical protein
MAIRFDVRIDESIISDDFFGRNSEKNIYTSNRIL